MGGYTHFGFALLGPDGGPVPHQNAAFTVEQAGQVLFATEDTHEYDGIFSFDVRFTRPGPYTVTATSGDMPIGTFAGEAVPPANATDVTVDLVAEPTQPGSRALAFTLSILDETGALLPHTDAIVELRAASDGAHVSRTHLHIHDAPIAFTQAFPQPGEYVANVIAYRAFPTGRSPDVEAVTLEFPVSVGAFSVPGLPAGDITPPAPLEQRGAVATADGLTLYATYDPNNQVGVGQTARLAGLLVDEENHTPVAHVDYLLTLTGPRGLVFSSETLHEYDGALEYLFVPEAPGVYDGTLVARFGDTELSVPLRLLVVPQALPLGGAVGLAELAVEGLDGIVAGEPTELTFVALANGMPAAHSEVDVTIYHDGEPPAYQFKLHTHDSGLTRATVVLPHGGAWKVRIDGISTSPEPVVFAPTLVEFTAADGEPPASVPAAAVEAPQAARVPGAFALLGLLALAGAAALVRRR